MRDDAAATAAYLLKEANAKRRALNNATGITSVRKRESRPKVQTLDPLPYYLLDGSTRISFLLDLLTAE